MTILPIVAEQIFHRTGTGWIVVVSLARNCLSFDELTNCLLMQDAANGRKWQPKAYECSRANGSTGDLIGVVAVPFEQVDI